MFTFRNGNNSTNGHCCGDTIVYTVTVTNNGNRLNVQSMPSTAFTDEWASLQQNFLISLIIFKCIQYDALSMPGSEQKHRNEWVVCRKAIAQNQKIVSKVLTAAVVTSCLTISACTGAGHMLDLL